MTAPYKFDPKAGHKTGLILWDMVPMNRSDTFAHLNLQPVYFDPVAPTEWRYFGDFDRLGDLYLKDFEIGSQFDLSGMKSYAWEARYKPYSVDLSDVRKMFETLKKVEKLRGKLVEDEGEPTSFAEYVMQMRRAMKIDAIIYDTRWLRVTDETSISSIYPMINSRRGTGQDYWRALTKGQEIRWMLENREKDMLQLMANLKAERTGSAA